MNTLFTDCRRVGRSRDSMQGVRPDRIPTTLTRSARAHPPRPSENLRSWLRSEVGRRGRRQFIYKVVTPFLVGVSASGPLAVAAFADLSDSALHPNGREAQSLRSSDFDLLIVLPGDPGPFDADHVGGQIEESPRGVTLGTIDLAELSPANPGDFASGDIRVAIYSPYGLIPRYRLRARLETYDLSRPGDIRLEDVGMGVVDIVSSPPTVGQEWDYDPSTVGKDGDDEPSFAGTLGDLSSGLGGRELFRTRQNFFGAWNYFTLVVAVGPQFFTPDALVPTSIELILQTY